MFLNFGKQQQLESTKTMPELPNGSFQSLVSKELGHFLHQLYPLYKEHGYDSIWKSQQFHRVLLKELVPTETVPLTHESLSNFLRSTINNQLQKRKKRQYCTREFRECSQHSLFGPESPYSNKYLAKFHTRNTDSIKKSDRLSQSLESLESSIPSLMNKIQPKHDRLGPSPNLLNNSHSHSSSRKVYQIYSQQEKQEVVEYSRLHGIRQASKYFGISTCKITVWIKQLQEQKHIRGRKPIDPDMEEKVYTWLKTELNKNSYVTQKMIRQKAKSMTGCKNFKASKGWLQKFFKRRPELFGMYTQNRKKGQYLFKQKQEAENSQQASKQDNYLDIKVKSEEIFDQDSAPKQNITSKQLKP